jgi:hypothetical protein
MQEIWKPIRGFEEFYEVSSNGNVRNANGRPLKPFMIRQGYLMVELFHNYKRTHARVNRLVAEAFIPNPDNRSEVNHKNGDKVDNRVENLEWTTKSENMIHAYRSGLQTKGLHPVRKVICLEDGKIYATMGDAARTYGITAKAVSLSCKRLSTKGKRNFRYYERRTDE